MIDFSFSNTMIKAYFDGDDSYVPASELMYLHQHPMINHSFLVQLEAMILKTTQVIEKYKISGQIIDRLVTHTKEIGEQLPNITAENSPIILRSMRSVYKLCNGLLNQYSAQ